MSEQLPNETPHERLGRALGSSELESLTHGRYTSLTRDRLQLEAPALYDKLERTGKLGMIVGEIGWPDENDRFEHMQREYPSLVKFKQYLTELSGSIEFPDKGLNNFYRPFVVEKLDPTKQYGMHQILQIVDATRPHMVRAEMLAPDLIASLQAILRKELEASKRRREVVPNVRRAYEDPRVLEGMYRAYCLMGRLVKADDPTRQAAMVDSVLKLQGNIQLEPVVDIHHALTE